MQYLKISEGYEVTRSVTIEMDPIWDGFTGVLIGLVFNEERYLFTETALDSGNRLLRFCSDNRTQAYAPFEAQLPDDGRSTMFTSPYRLGGYSRKKSISARRTEWRQRWMRTVL